MRNKQITLAARPSGWPQESDFRLVEGEVPAPGPGQVQVQTLYLSVDPYMRGRMSDRKSYARPIAIGEVMAGGAVGRVLESSDARFAPGDIVEGMLGWQTYAVMNAADVRKVDDSLAPISTALGVLGMPGLTAYFGLLDIGKPRAGETVLVSGAAGAVGSLVGQIAKIHGCRAVGIAGTDEKVSYITADLGFDAAFNYKTTQNYHAKITELCPAGVDVYFDNVGGETTDAVFPCLNVKGRVAVCGQISQYNLTKPELGPRILWLLIVKRARVEGFLVSDFAADWPEARAQMAQWLKDGKLKYSERIVDGLENAPRAFLEMMRGENIGKQLVRVSYGG